MLLKSSSQLSKKDAVSRVPTKNTNERRKIAVSPDCKLERRAKKSS